MSERPSLKPIAGLKPGDRAGAIPPPPRRRPVDSAAAPSGEAVVDDASPSVSQRDVGEGSRGASSRAKATGSRPKASQGVDVIRNVPVFLPAELADRFRAAAREQRISQVNLLLDALTATRDQLGELVAADQPKPSDGLFARPAPRGGEVVSATLNLRTVSGNIDTIDRLADEAGAKSRSQLMRLALAHYLDNAPAEQTS
jgi:hypothetical protein